MPSAQKLRRTGLHSLSGQPGLGLSSLEEGGGTCHAGDRERISSGARRRLTDLKVLEMIAVAALSAHSGPDTLLPAAHNPRTQQLEGAPCRAMSRGGAGHTASRWRPGPSPCRAPGPCWLFLIVSFILRALGAGSSQNLQEGPESLTSPPQRASCGQRS